MKKIVFADSDSVRQRLFRQILSDFEIEFVGTAADILNALSSAKRPDLVVASNILGDMDGVALYKAIREKPENELLPIILLFRGTANFYPENDDYYVSFREVFSPFKMEATLLFLMGMEKTFSDKAFSEILGDEKSDDSLFGDREFADETLNVASSSQQASLTDTPSSYEHDIFPSDPSPSGSLFYDAALANAAQSLSGDDALLKVPDTDGQPSAQSLFDNDALLAGAPEPSQNAPDLFGEANLTSGSELLFGDDSPLPGT